MESVELKEPKISEKKGGSRSKRNTYYCYFVIEGRGGLERFIGVGVKIRYSYTTPG